MTNTEENFDSPIENTIQYVRGLPFGTMFCKDKIEEICDFMPDDGDVIIATYPKTGTTWMQYIVHQILTKGETPPSFNDVLEKDIPFLEMAGVSSLENLTTRPRVYKHHMPYNMVRKNLKAKVIYVYRKPEDRLVSEYHFTKNWYLSVDFDLYFEDCLTGNISYGRYFEHILTYLEHKEDGNILFVCYEKLQVNRKAEILRVAKFLGDDFYDKLINNESVLDTVMEHTSFDYMKKNLTLILPKNPKSVFNKVESAEKMEKRKINFFRKGAVGEGKKSLSQTQLHRLYELAKELMKGTDILSEWLKE